MGHYTSAAITEVVNAESKQEGKLKLLLGFVLSTFDGKKRAEYFAAMERQKKRVDEFVRDPARFKEDHSLLLVLREWNSYSPAVPMEGEADRGGGYFIKHKDAGIVIDPGYDFLQNFRRAGGRLADITHIVVTHAHDDHTAELEQLLMLLRRRRRELTEANQVSQAKQVSLYLNQGAAHKFSGIIPLRGEDFITRVVILSRPEPGTYQTLPLADGVVLRVLPAYHDDAVTPDTAVGLEFQFDFGKSIGNRRIVFTSDTGLYPPLLDSNGRPMKEKTKRSGGKEESIKLDTQEAKALFKAYPEDIGNPDLLVAHIGSIKREEFEEPNRLKSSSAQQLSAYQSGDNKETEPKELREEWEWYYGNHLGLLGTLTMLDQLKPKAAIISEFGSELRHIRFDLVETLATALHKKQESDNFAQLTPVVAGDVTIVYNIQEGTFLCHDTRDFAPLDGLHQCELPEWIVEENSDVEMPKPGKTQRVILLETPLTGHRNGNRTEQYYRDLHDAALSYFKKPNPGN